MKKILSLALAAVLLVGMVFALVSCAGDIADGTYESAYGVIEIDGNKMKQGDEEEGYVVFKYSVDGDKITLTFDEIEIPKDTKKALEDAGVDVDAYIEQAESYYAEESTVEFPYEETADGFKMNNIEYKKQ